MPWSLTSGDISRAELYALLTAVSFAKAPARNLAVLSDNKAAVPAINKGSGKAGRVNAMRRNTRVERLGLWAFFLEGNLNQIADEL